MDVVPNKNVFRGTYHELCPGFKPQKRFHNNEKVVCWCRWCMYSEYHSGADTIEKIGGCVCMAGHDPKKVGEYSVTLKQKK